MLEARWLRRAAGGSRSRATEAVPCRRRGMARRRSEGVPRPDGDSESGARGHVTIMIGGHGPTRAIPAAARSNLNATAVHLKPDSPGTPA